jgi:hypothetical protein
MDHIFEFPDYYSNKKNGLIKMEKKLEKQSKLESFNNLFKSIIIEKKAGI